MSWKKVPILVSILPAILALLESPLQPLNVLQAKETRHKRQSGFSSNSITDDDAFCNFGFGDEVSFCNWVSPGSSPPSSRTTDKESLSAWTLSSGLNSLWVGGPLNDTSGDARGGYAFHETSSVPGVASKNAIMVSSVLSPTGANGRCLKFWYSVEGLSANKLRVIIKPKGEKEDAPIIWQTKDPTRGDWREAQALYTYSDNHTVIIEGMSADHNDPFNIFRGHVAVDDLSIRPGLECIGLCSFEGGLCDWNNVQNDDFDWNLGRGTQNPITGPPRDHSSSLGNSLGGAYIYVDSGFPRRPDDVARLESIDFQQTDPNNPPCMQFYSFMSGKGVGSLRVILQEVESRRERVIWALAGNQGSRWVMGQLPLSSSHPFKVIFEASIGIPKLGDIALDDLTIISGPCATLPTAASPPSSADCTFEEGACGWSNPSVRQRLDDLDFLRVQASELAFPGLDHTTGQKDGFYMALENPDQKVEGDRAWFLSPIMNGRIQTRCLSFWYLMFEPLSDEKDPNLGSLNAFIKREDNFGAIVLTPIWSMYNFQGLTWNFAQAPLRADDNFQVVIEAVWGSTESKGTVAIDDISVFEGSCPTIPESAIVRAGDCTFTKGSCGWRNITSDPAVFWDFATPIRRPVSITDHTYGAPVGYIFFDSFNVNSRLQLISPVMEPSLDRVPLCFTFWFSAFGSDPNTTLNIYQRSAHIEANPLASHNDDVLIWDYKPIQDRLSGWRFGQVSLVSSSRFQLLIDGKSFNGGFTMDDFKIYNGACAKRPRTERNF